MIGVKCESKAERSLCKDLDAGRPQFGIRTNELRGRERKQKGELVLVG
jgi:hypothetical protein